MAVTEDAGRESLSSGESVSTFYEKEMILVGRRETSVLVFFEERIQQREQDCKMDKVFTRSKVHVEEHMGKLGVSCMQ